MKALWSLAWTAVSLLFWCLASVLNRYGVICLVCSGWLVGAPSVSSRPTNAPVAAKYQPASPGQIALNRALALNLAERTRQTVVGTMHLVETEHFLICTAWNRAHDGFLADLAEQMYQTLSQQIALPPGE